MRDAAHVLAFAMWGSLVLGTLCVLRQTSWNRRAWVLGAVLFTIAVSLPCWQTTPDGVLKDTWEYWRYPRDLMGRHLFNGEKMAFGQSWQLLLVWKGYEHFGTLLVERALGLWWHCLFIAVVCALPIVPRALPVVIAILSATPFALWLQRHHLGSELLLTQVLLVHALMRRRPVLAGYWVALGIWGYVASFPLLAYPFLWLWRRSTSSYLVVACAMLPPVATGWWILNDRYAPTRTWDDLMISTRNAFLSLYDSSYSGAASWMWSYPKAQEMPGIVCLLLVISIVCAIWSKEGWRWIAAFVAGATPTIIGGAKVACSHRQMYMLLPLALLSAWPIASLREHRMTWALSFVLACVITDMGLTTWHSAAFWQMWKDVGWHGFK